MIHSDHPRRTTIVLRTWGSKLAVLSASVAALAACSGGGGRNAGPSPLETLTPPATAAAPLQSAVAAEVGPPAASPQAAVEGYLGAEIAGDAAGSFQLLAAEARTKVVDVNGWRAARTRLPRFTSYTVEPGGADGTVVTEVRLEPMVDPIVGVIPARATVTWRPVAEDGGWRVGLTGSTIEPRFPADDTADDVALTWVSQRQACTPDPAAATLLLQPNLASALCGQPGMYSAKAPAPLSSLPNPGAVIDAYGPDASSWARVVRLDGPAPLDVITAPLGDQWVVIGIAGG